MNLTLPYNHRVKQFGSRSGPTFEKCKVHELLQSVPYFVLCLVISVVFLIELSGFAAYE